MIESTIDVPEYFCLLRNDILAHVPTHARNILSVGCGAGATEAVLVERGAEVVGIEIDSSAAAVAEERGIEVIRGDALAVGKRLANRSFDCLIYADVLEHTPDPLSILRQHVSLLSAGGVVIISVPNFRHYLVLKQLVVNGHVRYVDAGILDRTHLRITTRRMVIEWMRQAGLEVFTTEYRMSRRRERLLSWLSGRLLQEFVAGQIIAVGRKTDKVAESY